MKRIDRKKLTDSKKPAKTNFDAWKENLKPSDFVCKNTYDEDVSVFEKHDRACDICPARKLCHIRVLNGGSGEFFECSDLFMEWAKTLIAEVNK